MLDRLLPRRIDNTYRGSKIALWILGAIGFVKLGVSAGAIFSGADTARSADGIPLETFTAAGAKTTVALFAVWGLGQFLLGLLCVLALVRYRAMAPLVFALLLLENAGRKAILWFVPYATTGETHNGEINAALIALTFVGLLLSLPRRGESESTPA